MKKEKGEGERERVMKGEREGDGKGGSVVRRKLFWLKQSR